MPSLDLTWSSTYDYGIQGSDGFAAMAPDGFGNTYAVGNSLGGGGSYFSYEVLTTKFDGDGNLLWEQRFDSAGGTSFADKAVDLAVDTDGSVVVLGTGPTLSGDQDVLLFRYDAFGNLVWQTTWDNNWSDGASNVEIAQDGSIYVLAASYYGLPEVSNTVLLKFDAFGNLLWERDFDGHSGTENAVLMRIGPQGNLYIGGTTIHTQGTVDFDWLGLKYDPGGNLLWSFERGGSIQYPDYVNDMALTDSGDMILTGYTVNTIIGWGGVTDITTMKVDSAGVFQWEAVYTAVQGRTYTVATDAADNVYVAGSPGIVLSYDASGQQRWIQDFDDASSRVGTPRAMLTDGQGSLFIAGTTFDSGVGNDILIQQLDTTTGVEKALFSYGGPLDQALPIGSGSRMMSLVGPHTLYLAGSNFNGHDSDALLLRCSR